MLSGSLSAILNVALIAVTYPAYLSFLGYELYGLWLVLSTAFAFSRIGDLGMSSALAKILAEQQGDTRKMGQTIASAFFVLGACGLLATTLLYFGLPSLLAQFSWGQAYADSIASIVPLVAVLCGVGIITEGFPAILTGLGRMDCGAMSVALGRMVGAATALVLMLQGWELGALLLCTSVTYVFIQLFCLAKLKKHSKLRFRDLQFCLVQLKRLLHLGSGILGGSLLTLAILPLSRLVLSQYAGLASVPVFDLAYRGAMQLRGIIESGLKALMPAFSELSAEGGTRLLPLKRRALRMTFGLGTLVYFLAYLALVPLLQFWLGDAYVPEMAQAAYLTLAASYLSLLGVPIYYLAMGLGRIRICFNAHLIQAVLNAAVLASMVLTFGKLTPFLAAAALLVAFVGSYLYLMAQAFRLRKQLMGDPSWTIHASPS